MWFVVVDGFVYGSFESWEHGKRWAESHLPGRHWSVTRLLHPEDVIDEAERARRERVVARARAEQENMRARLGRRRA
jgi:hypothetical protein